MKPWEQYQKQEGPWTQYAEPVETTDGLMDQMKSRVSGFFDPETWKQAGQELANFPPFPTEDGRLPRQDGDVAFPEGFEETAKDIAVMAGPTTSAGKLRSMFQPKVADPVRQETLKSIGEVGYSVPRSTIKETPLTNIGERFGGKQAIEATAELKNQPITNRLAAKALGIAEDTPLTPEVLSGIRETAGKAYEVAKSVGVLKPDSNYMKALSNIETKFAGASKDFPELASNAAKQLASALRKPQMTAKGVVEQIKYLRDSAKSNLMPTAGPEAKLLGKAQRSAADALDDLLGSHVSRKLGKKAHKDYLEARKQIAKTYTVEKALNPATGNVVGREIAKQSKKVPLTGELKKIADFSKAYPLLSRERTSAPASGGLFEPLVYGISGGAAYGDPSGAAAAFIPMIGKPLARKLMTTVPKSRPPRNIMGNALAQRGVLGGGVLLDRENRNSFND